jgi:hypothetical protein
VLSALLDFVLRPEIRSALGGSFDKQCEAVRSGEERRPCSKAISDQTPGQRIAVPFLHTAEVAVRSLQSPPRSPPPATRADFSLSLPRCTGMGNASSVGHRARRAVAGACSWWLGLVVSVGVRRPGGVQGSRPLVV